MIVFVSILSNPNGGTSMYGAAAKFIFFINILILFKWINIF